MKLYNRVNSALGLACVALLAFSASASAVAKEPNPLANIMRGQAQQSTVDQASGVSNARLLKLMSDTAANRGVGVCGDESPDAGEQCDDGNLLNMDGCDSTCQVEAGSDCTAAIAGLPDLNIITNGGFEDGPVVWTEATAGIPFGPISSPLNCGGCNLASEGEWWVWNGGWSEATVSSVEQTVTIPTNATTLKVDIWEGFCVPAGGSGDFVEIIIDGNVEYNSGTCDDDTPGTYEEHTIDLVTGGYNDGGLHTIKIEGTMDFTAGDPQTGSILVDNVRLNVPLVPPVPPMPSVCYIGMCSDSIVSSGEGCDDGNTDDGDGCSSSCQVEELTHVCFNDTADTGLGKASGALSIADDITDGSLEQGAPNPDWVEDGTQFAPICSEAFCGAALANDGDFFGWFGGSDMPNEQTLTQSDVTISTDATALTFDFLVGVCDSASDVIRVNVDGSPIWERFCTEDTAAYATVSVDLTSGNALAVTACGAGGCNDGLAHEVQIHGETFAVNAGNSNHFVDDIRIEYAVSPDRAANPSVCIELDGICGLSARGAGATGWGIEQFETGLGVMTTFGNGTLGTPLIDGVFTTTVDDWEAIGDSTGCGGGIANWPGGNLTGGTGEAACADADGAAESLAATDPATDCINALDPTLSCQTRTYLCTPALDTTSMTDPGVTATVHYQTAAQDGDTPEADDDEIFQLLVGDTTPNAISIGGYRSAGVVLDHNSNTTLSSGSLTVGVNLDDFRDPSVQGCEDPLEDPPCTISGFEAPLDANNMYVCVHYAGIYSWYGQVDNVASRADNCTVGDADFDLVPDDEEEAGCVLDPDCDDDTIRDDVDNCDLVPNLGQEDNDGDGAGDVCDDNDDNDAHLDTVDNCTFAANDSQLDTDGDSIGNACDADIDGSVPCFVNFLDSNIYVAAFFGNAGFGPNPIPTPNWNPDTDNNGDGFTNFADLQVLSGQFFGPPGPSAFGCN